MRQEDGGAGVGVRVQGLSVRARAQTRICMAIRSGNMWKIGDLISGGDGYGFDVTTDRGNPLVWFEYETKEEGQSRRKAG